ncbi:hypothetical protein GCM10010430_63200 [Kitasatospora cystarginea]|uniref:Uncharacterized protein n=1 Tax=Kitasatospora cystarginea TaxID=58350 RepID=A0ABP5RNY8_9ACTN
MPISRRRLLAAATGSLLAGCAAAPRTAGRRNTSAAPGVPASPGTNRQASPSVAQVTRAAVVARYRDRRQCSAVHGGGEADSPASAGQVVSRLSPAPGTPGRHTPRRTDLARGRPPARGAGASALRTGPEHGPDDGRSHPGAAR